MVDRPRLLSAPLPLDENRPSISQDSCGREQKAPSPASSGGVHPCCGKRCKQCGTRHFHEHGHPGRIAPSDEPPISNGAVARRFRTPPLEGSKQKKRRPKQAASLIACGSSKSGELRQTLMPTTAHAEADRTEAEHHQRPSRRFRDSIDREIIGFEGVAGRAQAKRR